MPISEASYKYEKKIPPTNVYKIEPFSFQKEPEPKPKLELEEIVSTGFFGKGGQRGQVGLTEREREISLERQLEEERENLILHKPAPKQDVFAIRPEQKFELPDASNSHHISKLEIPYELKSDLGPSAEELADKKARANQLKIELADKKARANQLKIETAKYVSRDIQLDRKIKDEAEADRKARDKFIIEGPQPKKITARELLQQHVEEAV